MSSRPRSLVGSVYAQVKSGLSAGFDATFGVLTAASLVAPLLGTVTAADVVMQRNSVEILRLRSDGPSIQGASPVLELRESDQGADGKTWWVNSAGGEFRIDAVNDARTVATRALTIARSGTSVPTMDLGATATRIATGKKLEIYNTADQTTNYEKAELLFETNYAKLKTSKGGTGTARGLRIEHQDGSGIAVGGFANLAIYGSAGGGCSLSTDDGVSLNITSRITSASNPGFYLSNGTFGTPYNASSGTQKHFMVQSNVNQTGTGLFVGVEADFNPVAVGSGGFYLMRLLRNSAERFRVDGAEPTSGNTNTLLAYHNGTSVTFQRVSLGAADSGGSGFKVLRVPN